MSDYDDLDYDLAQLEYSGGVGTVLAVNGHPATHRRGQPAGGQVEWTTFDRQPPYRTDTTGPTGRVQRVDRQSVDARREPDHSQYWKARRRYEAADRRRANPDFAVYGCAVPYGVKLDGGRNDRLVFTADTDWLLPSKTLMLRTEHSGLAGTFEVDETPGGLYAHGTILGELRGLVRDRTDLSPALTVIDTVPGPGGVLEVRAAHLHEVSLVRRPMWRPHTACTIWQRAAAA